ncbi:MAG: LytTR family DNA-binding domain-containing protein [Eubacteriaceae bacterium]|nr:LytTR family DNA-binding domain-containing protein [Eubacteriaceae bacterium]
MYHIAICDDDERYIQYLEKLLVGRVFLPSEEVLFYRYHSGEELDRALDKRIPFDLLILDMQMESLDGDETARRFRMKYPDTLLVFCSGICLPTVKSFEANAYRFLLKEYDSDKMYAELSNIIGTMRENSLTSKYPISYRYDTEFVPIKDVLYVSKRKRGCRIVTFNKVDGETKEHLCNKKIEEVFHDLKPWGFAFAHNSYFVSLRHIIRLEPYELELVQGTVLTVSRSRGKVFREEFACYLADKY